MLLIYFDNILQQLSCGDQTARPL